MNYYERIIYVYIYVCIDTYIYVYEYIREEKHFQSGLDQHFMQKKSCDKQRIGGLSSHKYKYLLFPIYAVKNKL